jgi:hypothetical protein
MGSPTASSPAAIFVAPADDKDEEAAIWLLATNAHRSDESAFRRWMRILANLVPPPPPPLRRNDASSKGALNDISVSLLHAVPIAAVQLADYATDICSIESGWMLPNLAAQT